ncbi:hypothetical protein [Streptomyces sp. HD]|uniref:hypothetical protein n=1 Tax=Streptomyces sp. HD TaxID=3020892 RepID=UPI00232B0519|nr:hypothetical protein [Streptomyces sp. HD]MDC0768524.1 hypothetical protein [Streptomyces sp. HD]
MITALRSSVTRAADATNARMVAFSRVDRQTGTTTMGGMSSTGTTARPGKGTWSRRLATVRCRPRPLATSASMRRLTALLAVLLCVAVTAAVLALRARDELTRQPAVHRPEQQRPPATPAPRVRVPVKRPHRTPRRTT